jgi:hypothetical protein
VVRASTRLVTFPSDHLIQNAMKQNIGKIEAGEAEGALEAVDAHARFVVSTMSHNRDTEDLVQSAVPAVRPPD